jgi:hypothetical protein
MKRRLEKKIRARMLANSHESYSAAKLIILQQERKAKIQFRNTVVTLHGTEELLPTRAIES